jgi:uncharacterized membrane protein YgcG
VDFWDLTKLLFRRWYFALPALVLTAVASVVTLVTVQPNYIATASIQLVPPVTAPNEPGMATLDQRNPWVALGLDALATAATVSLTDGSIVETLDTGGYTDSFTPTMSSSSPLLKLEVTGTTQDQALRTADFLAKRYDQAVKDLQAGYNVAPGDFIVTKRIDNTTINSLKQSDSKVKRALVAVAGAGLLITIAWTIGMDTLLRRRSRRRVGGVPTDHPFDPPSGPLPTGATRFDRVSEPPVSRLPLPEAIPAIRSFTDRARSGSISGAAPVGNGSSGGASSGGMSSSGMSSSGGGASLSNLGFPPESPTAVVRTNDDSPAESTASITMIPPDGTVILPLSHKSWRQRDASDGEGRQPR